MEKEEKDPEEGSEPPDSFIESRLKVPLLRMILFVLTKIELFFERTSELNQMKN